MLVAVEVPTKRLKGLDNQMRHYAITVESLDMAKIHQSACERNNVQPTANPAPTVDL